MFCGIVAGHLESSLVHEDDQVVAFLDIRPLTQGHLLVVPRAHAASLADLDGELGAAVFRVGQRLALALRRSGVPCEGVNLFLADGAAAGQEVGHVHLHVLPRTPGDGFRISARPRFPERAGLDATAALVRSAASALADGLTANRPLHRLG